MINEIVSYEEFTNALKSEKPVLVDLYATWCGPCKMLSPIIKEFAGEMDGKIDVIKVDVDVVEKVAIEYGVNSIPTLLVFVQGELKERSVGLTSKAGLSQMVIKYL